MIYFIIGVGIVGFLFLSRMVKAEVKETENGLLSFIDSKARANSLEPALVKAIAKTESNMNPLAKNPSDPSYGLMQITPGLGEDYGLIKDSRNVDGGDIGLMMNVSNNLDVACWYLDKLLKTFDFDGAIQGYNVGMTGYRNGRRNLDYLEKVRHYYERYS